MKTIFASLAAIFILCSCTKNETIVNPAKTDRDIIYGPAERNKMDVWYPQNYNSSSRIVFLMHPGGFYEGDKSKFDWVATYFQEQGFVAVNLNYRFIDSTGLLQNPPLHRSSVIKVSDALTDVDLAVNFVIAHASQWKIATGKMYMAGHSAGALLTLAYTQSTLNDDNRIKAGANWAGQTDLSIPSDTLLPGIPPFFKDLLFRWTGYMPKQSNNLAYMAISGFWQAYAHTGHPMISCYPQYNGDDFITPNSNGGYVNTQNFHQLLRSRNIAEKLVYYPGEGHGLDILPATWPDVLDKTRAFFESN